MATPIPVGGVVAPTADKLSEELRTAPSTFSNPDKLGKGYVDKLCNLTGLVFIGTGIVLAPGEGLKEYPARESTPALTLLDNLQLARLIGQASNILADRLRNNNPA